jgi:peroxiredoxin
MVAPTEKGTSAVMLPLKRAAVTSSSPPSAADADVPTRSAAAHAAHVEKSRIEAHFTAKVVRFAATHRWVNVRRAIAVIALVACSPAPRGPAARSTPELAGQSRAAAQLEAARGSRPALVSLWATWCEACRTEFGALNRLDAEARDRGALVVGVAVGERADVAGRFAEAHGLRYAQIADEDFVLSDALGERRIPAILVLDRTGRIVYRGGALDDAALRAFRAVQ